MGLGKAFSWRYVLTIIVMVMNSICYAATATALADRKVHIVYLGSLSEGEYHPTSQHLSLLSQVVENCSADDSLVRSYKRSFNGFAANLTDKEREKLSRMEGVVSVFPSKLVQLQTTRSWDFIGFPETVQRNLTMESDIIVGVIDTGVWVKSPSFSDEGYGPVPKRWKGFCQPVDATCNKKLIGIRDYDYDHLKAFGADRDGHGTLIASIVAGNTIKDASFYGLAGGTARGAVPSARIASYKLRCDNILAEHVCGLMRACCNEAIMVVGCREEDMLAAFDDAIADGVDVINVALGGSAAVDFSQDVIAIGAFHAMEKGIITTHSAGNCGSKAAATVASVAPWIFSVAASSTDRRFLDKVVLGNGKTLTGNSVNHFTMEGSQMVPLIHGKDAPVFVDGCNNMSASICMKECLNDTLIAGKILVCDYHEGIYQAPDVGALGSIALDERAWNASFVVPLPALTLSSQDYDVVRSFMNSTRAPQASILRSEAVNYSSAPFIASFSSRGPNRILPQVLKPDISAPGVEILGAHSAAAPLGLHDVDSSSSSSSNFTLASGTSISSSHVAGAAAYVKSFHPDWSASAIKSALMTTARPMDPAKNQEMEFAYGAGHLDPVSALNPGLIYETSKDDYVKMLCYIGYDESKLRKMSKDQNITCPTPTDPKTLPMDLNYPSMSVMVDPDKPFNIDIHRSVTNVGLPNSTYQAKVTSTSTSVDIKVVPNTLLFKSVGEIKTFVVSVAGGKSGVLPKRTIVSASVLWSDGIHQVRSPLVVFTSDILTTTVPQNQ